MLYTGMKVLNVPRTFSKHFGLDNKKGYIMNTLEAVAKQLYTEYVIENTNL